MHNYSTTFSLLFYYLTHWVSLRGASKDQYSEEGCHRVLHMWCGGTLKTWVLGIGTSSLLRSKYQCTVTAASTFHHCWPSTPFMIHLLLPQVMWRHLTQAFLLSKSPGLLCSLQKNPSCPPDEIWMQVIQSTHTHTESVRRHEVTHCYTACSVGITLASLYPCGNH